MRMRILAAILFLIPVFLVSRISPSVYATVCHGFSASPNPVPQGTAFTVSGTNCLAGTYNIQVFADPSGSCSGSFVTQSDTIGAGGNFQVSFSSSSLAIGDHCIEIFIGTTLLINGSCPLNLGNGCLAVTAPPIPEYPLGLGFLAVLTLIAYSVTKHRTQMKPD